MPRARKPVPATVAQRLAAVKIMAQDMADAMPTMARDLRRSACETLDDLIAELGGSAR
jgi:hypothetical protein